MLRKIGLAAALIALSSPSLAARAADVLARTGKWVVDYNTDACHLAAQFGTGDDMVLMRITRYEPGDAFDLGLYGRRMRILESRRDVTVDFGIKGKPVKERAIHGTSGKQQAMFLSSVRFDGWEGKSSEEVAPSVTHEQEKAVDSLTVSITPRRTFRLDFGPVDKAMAELRRCSDNLVRSWGYDPAAQSARLRPVSAVTAPSGWLSPGDYPAAALMQGHNGLVQFRLDVDANGKVGGCYVLARTNPDEFADITCEAIARRAKLQPALDAQGKPVRSYYVQKVLWQSGS